MLSKRQIYRLIPFFKKVQKKWQGNWTLNTNSDFFIPKSLKPDVVDPWYLKLWILLDKQV